MIKRNIEKFNIMKERLNELRIEKNLTQKAVADELGISHQAYQAYEAGISVPTLDNFLKLIALFDCSADYLLGLSEY